MSKESIRERMERMAEGARLIDEMRKDGRLPANFNREDEGSFRDMLIQRGLARRNRTTTADVLDDISSLHSGNNLPSNVATDPSGLGFQARAAMFNAGNDKRFNPPRVNSAMGSLYMDLCDQAGIPYNMSNGAFSEEL